MCSFSEEVKEEIIEMRKDIEKMKEESLAYEMVKDARKQNKRLFTIWIITFIAFIGLLSYTIYLLNDIGYEEIVEETTEYTQEIEDNGDINDSYIINGGDNTWQK